MKNIINNFVKSLKNQRFKIIDAESYVQKKIGVDKYQSMGGYTSFANTTLK